MARKAKYHTSKGYGEEAADDTAESMETKQLAAGTNHPKPERKRERRKAKLNDLR